MFIVFIRVFQPLWQYINVYNDVIYVDSQSRLLIWHQSIIIGLTNKYLLAQLHDQDSCTEKSGSLLPPCGGINCCCSSGLQRWLSFRKVLLCPQNNCGALTEWLSAWRSPVALANLIFSVQSSIPTSIDVDDRALPPNSKVSHFSADWDQLECI